MVNGQSQWIALPKSLNHVSVSARLKQNNKNNRGLGGGRTEDEALIPPNPPRKAVQSDSSTYPRPRGRLLIPWSLKKSIRHDQKRGVWIPRALSRGEKLLESFRGAGAELRKGVGFGGTRQELADGGPPLSSFHSAGGSGFRFLLCARE